MQKGKRKGVGISVKPPRRAAVALTVAPGSGKRYEDALATARGKMRLKDIGVSDVRIRYTVTGGILIEVPGEESAAKADNLAAKLIEIFPEDEDIRVTRPTKKSELKISGLDGSIQTEEVIAEVVAATSDCSENDVRIGEIKKRSPRGLGAVCVPNHSGQKSRRQR